MASAPPTKGAGLTRAADRILEGIGVAKRTANPEFDIAYEHYQALLRQVVGLERALMDLYSQLRSFSGAQTLVTGEFRSFYGEAAATHQPMRNFARIREVLDQRLPEKFSGAYKKAILDRLVDWQNELASVQVRARALSVLPPLWRRARAQSLGRPLSVARRQKSRSWRPRVCSSTTTSARWRRSKTRATKLQARASR